MTFQEEILTGIPDTFPDYPVFDSTVSRAPARKNLLTPGERTLALKNALRYFKPEWHKRLLPEFSSELDTYGRIYMYRFMPRHRIFARPIQEYPAITRAAAAIMLMIQNNLDHAIAQHPYELITYGGNGAVFQNWAQYALTMKYLAELTLHQTLHLYSGHPLGLFPSPEEAPRVVITNGMMIPNYSSQDDWERFNAMGVTQYGQMTAGSFMYIGPQGIVHGTTITLLNAGRKRSTASNPLAGKLFVSSGLGGMSGAQPKAGNIAGCVSVIAEVNELAVRKRHAQGWVDEVISDSNQLVKRVKQAIANQEVVSIAFHGNIVDLWELLDRESIQVDLGSDQTSLHNPWAGGYYPVGLTFEASTRLMVEQPEEFKRLVKASLVRHASAIRKHTDKGMYFFDYGNAFLLEASRAGADILRSSGEFIYPSYVQDIMGPICFDFGFGPFRWVCLSGSEEDLALTDRIAAEVIAARLAEAPGEIQAQLQDNLHWIRQAAANALVVGSKARILYADASTRIAIALAFNAAIREGRCGPIVLGRDHHDVSGTDSPYRETSNIYDGSRFTADMAIHNVIGDSFRGATWVSIHNGGGVGWGEVMNGGFGLFLDGTKECDARCIQMLHFDVNNGIARRSWARNSNANVAIREAMKTNPDLKVTLPHFVDDALLKPE